MVKIGKRARLLIPTISVIALVVLLTAFVWFPDLLTLPSLPLNGRKMEISDLKIEPSGNWQSSNIMLTVTDTYNSPITVIGSKVNGVNYGYSKIEIPPGQTQDVVLSLDNLVITKSANYDIELTCTFEDGKYEVFSASLSSEEYVGAFIINGQSINATSNSTVYSVTVQNTGNIPLVSLKFTIGNYESSLPLSKYLMPKSTTTLDAVIPLVPQIGETYIVTLEGTFADGSTFSAKSTYAFS